MSGFATILIPSPDLAASRAFYSALVGAAPFMDESYYVAYQCDAIQLGLDPHGSVGTTGPVVYWETDDLERLTHALLAAGGGVLDGPRPVGGGKTVATLHDPAGNVIGLQHQAA